MEQEVILALINNLPAIIAAVASLLTAFASAYIIVTQRGHLSRLDQLLLRKQDNDVDDLPGHP